MFFSYKSIPQTGGFKNEASFDPNIYGRGGCLQLGAKSTRIDYFSYPGSSAGFATRASTKGFRSNDNLSDLLSRIRNGYFRSFEDILVIDSKQNRELLDALICTGYIYNWSEAPIAADGCN